METGAYANHKLFAEVRGRKMAHNFLCFFFWGGAQGRETRREEGEGGKKGRGEEKRGKRGKRGGRGRKDGS